MIQKEKAAEGVTQRWQREGGGGEEMRSTSDQKNEDPTLIGWEQSYESYDYDYYDDYDYDCYYYDDDYYYYYYYYYNYY